MSGGEIKVTDRRMFTADGELREEYRFLEQSATGVPSSGSDSEADSEAGADLAARAEVQDTPRPAGATPVPPVLEEVPVQAPEPVAAERFVDLLSMLIEPALMYLGELRAPGAPVDVDLPMARLHIELLETLDMKTRGNLTREEAETLENALYQVKMMYVQKSGAPR